MRLLDLFFIFLAVFILYETFFQIERLFFSREKEFYGLIIDREKDLINKKFVFIIRAITPREELGDVYYETVSIDDFYHFAKAERVFVKKIVGKFTKKHYETYFDYS